MAGLVPAIFLGSGTVWRKVANSRYFQNFKMLMSDIGSLVRPPLAFS
jgi:hypothetical protein